MPPSINLALGFMQRAKTTLKYTPWGDPRRICGCPYCTYYFALLDGIRP